MNESEQMFLWEEPPVNPFPSRDFSEDLKTHAEISCSSSELLRLVFAFPGWSGKTSPEFFQATEDETLRRFWDYSRAGQFKPLETVAREVAGLTLEYWGAHPPRTESPGPSLMLNTSEFRNGAAVCSLSDILETGDVPQRYFLTPKACAGILRRAERRGKELTMTLRQALQQVAGEWNGGRIAEDKTP